MQVARDRRRAERVDDRDRLAAAVDAGGVEPAELVCALELLRRVAVDADLREAARRRPRLCLCLARMEFTRSGPPPCWVTPPPAAAAKRSAAPATAARTAGRPSLLRPTKPSFSRLPRWCEPVTDDSELQAAGHGCARAAPRWPRTRPLTRIRGKLSDTGSRPTRQPVSLSPGALQQRAPSCSTAMRLFFAHQWRPLRPPPSTTFSTKNSSRTNGHRRSCAIG